MNVLQILSVNKASASKSNELGTVDRNKLSFLRSSLSHVASKPSKKKTSKGTTVGSDDSTMVLEWAAFEFITTSSGDQPRETSKEYAMVALSMYNVATTLMRCIVSRYAGQNAGAPELLSPMYDALTQVMPQLKPAFPEAIQLRHADMCEDIQKMLDVKSSRKPLQWREVGVSSLDSLTPKYEVNYSLRKDADPDKDRVKVSVVFLVCACDDRNELGDAGETVE